MATKNIGKWSVQAGVDASGFDAGIGKMENRLKGFVTFGNRLGGMGIGAAMGLGGALGIGSLSALGSTFSNLAGQAEELGAVNDVLGTSVEWLSAMQTVAGEAGLRVDGFTAAINRLNMHLGNAVMGGSEAQDTFEQLGLDWQHLRSQRFEETFSDIAAALSSIADPSVRARLAQELFGRGEGARMLRLMQGGAEGVADALADVRARGGFMTSEELRRLQAADRALDSISTSWQNFVRRTSAEAAPTLTALLDFLGTGASGIGMIARDATIGIGDALSNDYLRGLLNMQSDAEASATASERRLAAARAEALQGHFASGGTESNVPFHLLSLEQRRQFQARGLAPVGGVGVVDINALSAPSAAETGAGVRALERDLLGMARTAGLSGTRLRIAELRLQGASAEALEFAETVAGNMEREQARRETMLRDIDEGQRLTEQARTPLQSFAGDIIRMNELVNEGTLSVQSRNALLMRQLDSMEESPLLGNLQRGSDEVAQIMQAAMNPQADRMASMLTVLQSMEQQQQDTNDFLERHEDLFERIAEHLETVLQA